MRQLANGMLGMALWVLVSCGARTTAPQTAPDVLEPEVVGAVGSELSALALEAGGLDALYFPQLNFGGTPVKARSGSIDFNWGAGGPPLLGVSDRFSVRWSGKVQPRFSETYTFITRADDGVRLFIGGKRVINDWTDHAVTERRARVPLEAGKFYDLTLEYYENLGQASVQLLWQSASQPRQVIPAGALYSDVMPTLSAPQNLRTGEVGPTGTLLFWDRVPEAFAYALERRVNGGAWESQGSPQGSPAFLSDLAPNTDYEYRVRAIRSTEVSPWSALAFRTPAAFELPTVQNFRVGSVSATGARLEWDRVEGAFSYQLERRVGSDPTWLYVGLLEGSPAFEGGLTPSTQYEYRIRARRGDGRGPWTTLAFGTFAQ